MWKRQSCGTAIAVWMALLFFCFSRAISFADEPGTRDQLLLLQKQNDQLQKQLQKQQELIDELNRKVSAIQENTSRPAPESAEPKTGTRQPTENPPAVSQAFHVGKVDLSGEGGVAFFAGQTGSQSPHPEFRIDEARVFLEAPVWKDVYFYSELDLVTPEEPTLSVNVGELYLDFEDVSQLWGQDRVLNIRAGQFYTPFGEEYQTRFAIDNPLVFRSLTDIWGVSPGLELYGKVGPVQYVAAVQNGGGADLQALQDDKSVAGRIGIDPQPWLHLSISGMRTGNLSVRNGVSAIWFGNGFFRSLGSPLTTTTFHANLVEGDVQMHWPWLQFKSAGGYVDYGDSNTVRSDHRDVYYYYVEGVHDFTRHFYGAARFSQIFANNGFPIVGSAPMGAYLFGPLTTDYWRLGLGLGYRFSSNLIIKGEYSFNHGRELDGTVRDHEDIFALEAAYRF